MHSVTLLTGSNDEAAEKILLQAAELLAERIGRVESSSGIYPSEAWGFVAENIFYNQALRLNSELSPEQVLDAAQEVEQRLGRSREKEQREKQRTGQRYASRRVDVDIMFYDDEIISTPRLSVPHPLMQERLFALKPLCEIERRRLHPVLGRTLGEIYEDLKQRTREEI